VTALYIAYHINTSKFQVTVTAKAVHCVVYAISISFSGQIF